MVSETDCGDLFVVNVVTQLPTVLRSDKLFHQFITPDVIRLQTLSPF